MAIEKAGSVVALRRAFGQPKPPERITQEAYDSNGKHLRRLVRLHPDERAEAGDLWDYTQDLRYTEIQGSLLAYLLPFCLEAWREDLRGQGGYGGFVEHFYPVLADRRIFSDHLTPKQTAAVSEFMRESILEEIDDQRGLSYRGSKARPYRWFSALTTYGVLLPDIERLWTAWWSLGPIGRAVGVLQYVSCLMYSDNENPIFEPWTRESGGGPPTLWEYGGHLYNHRWLQPNVDFLRGILNVRAVTHVIAQAVQRLVGQSEYALATQISADVPLCISVLEARCAELPKFLEIVQDSVTQFEWSP